MTLRHWQIFVAVAECGSMRAAAEKLYISQPAVSQAIRELEKHYDMPLFDRLSQRIYLTQAGRDVLPHARRALDAYVQLDAFASGKAARSILRVGGSVTAGTVILPKLIHQLARRMPDADIRVLVNNTAVIEQQILDSELDIAIVEGFVRSPELVRCDLCDDELVLVVGQRHPLFHAQSITLEELSRQKLISRESGSTERNQFDNFLLEHGVQIHRAWSCTNTETIKAALHSGEGIAILSRMIVEDEVARGEFRILNVEQVRIERKIQLIYHKDKALTDVFVQFLKLCESHEKTNSIE